MFTKIHLVFFLFILCRLSKKDLKKTEVKVDIVDGTKIFNEYYHAKGIIDGKSFGCWLEKKAFFKFWIISENGNGGPFVYVSLLVITWHDNIFECGLINCTLRISTEIPNNGATWISCWTKMQQGTT